MKIESSKPLLIVSGIFFVFFIMIIGINFFFLDNRDNMTSLPETEMGFTNTVIELNEMYIDKNSEVVEFNIDKIDYFIISDDFEISLTDQDNRTLKADIIKVSDEEVDDDIYKTGYKVRFNLPEDTWYIKAKISRDDESYDFTIDYRDLRKTELK